MQDEFELEEGLHYHWQTGGGLRLTEQGAGILKAAGWEDVVTVYVMATPDGARISIKVLSPEHSGPAQLNPAKGVH